MLGPAREIEVHALAAMGLERTDPAAARAEWRAYLEASPRGPWVEEARAHEASLVPVKAAPKKGKP